MHAFALWKRQEQVARRVAVRRAVLEEKLRNVQAAVAMGNYVSLEQGRVCLGSVCLSLGWC